jgi:hypothetical protein
VNDKFGFFFNLKYKCCKGKSEGDTRKKAFQFMDNYINKNLDVCHFINNSIQLELMKKLILNPMQNLTMKHLQKPNVYDMTHVERFNITSRSSKKIEIEDLYNYFNRRIVNNELDEIDKKIIPILNQVIQVKS